MDKHEAAIARGEDAKRIVDSPIFTEAFETIRTAYFRQLEELPIAGNDEHGTPYSEHAADLLRRIKCVGDVKTALTAMVTTGKISEKVIERQNLTQKVKSGMTNILNRNRSR
jgi:hypothetical protein